MIYVVYVVEFDMLEYVVDKAALVIQHTSQHASA